MSLFGVDLCVYRVQLVVVLAITLGMEYRLEELMSTSSHSRQYHTLVLGTHSRRLFVSIYV